MDIRGLSAHVERGDHTPGLAERAVIDHYAGPLAEAQGAVDAALVAQAEAGCAGIEPRHEAYTLGLLGDGGDQVPRPPADDYERELLAHLRSLDQAEAEAWAALGIARHTLTELERTITLERDAARHADEHGG